MSNLTRKPKKRNWVAICYPESAPDNWLEILSQTGLEIAISPLHDRDIEEDGITPKKPHWHLIMCWPGPTTYLVAKAITDSIKATVPQPLESVRGNYRYFTHQDNPDKFQYDAKDIRTLGGFDIVDHVDLTKSEVRQIKLRLFDAIQDQGFVEYSHFMEWVRENGTSDDFDVASTNTIFYTSHLCSRRNVKKEVAAMTLQDRLNNQPQG